jgi:uncharacterized protein YutE (UPF0331/DUF86 family)
MNDILINKMATIQRCLKRIKEEFNPEEVNGEKSKSEDEFRLNFTKQDSVVLNLQRACEASIDIANHIIKSSQLGVPQSARDSFQLLAQNQCIKPSTAETLKKMVGLRNIAVHDYQALNIDIVIAVVKHHLADFELFCAEIKVLKQQDPL